MKDDVQASVVSTHLERSFNVCLLGNCIRIGAVLRRMLFMFELFLKLVGKTLRGRLKNVNALFY